jgi:hypothetical protein
MKKEAINNILLWINLRNNVLEDGAEQTTVNRYIRASNV